MSQRPCIHVVVSIIVISNSVVSASRNWMMLFCVIFLCKNDESLIYFPFIMILRLGFLEVKFYFASLTFQLRVCFV